MSAKEDIPTSPAMTVLSLAAVLLLAAGSFPLQAQDDTLPGVESFSIPNLGAWSIASKGTETDTRSGYGRISVDDEGTTTPSGNAILGFRQDGVLIAEASVPASEPVREGRIFAEVNGPVNTGLTIANPNNTVAIIDFYLNGADGARFAEGSFELGAHRQIAKFLNEEPFNIGNEVSGTLTFTSTAPIAVIALRGFTNRDGEYLMTTLPVSPLASGATISSDRAYFPLFVDGDGWVSQVILVNSMDEVINGTVEFLGSGGGTTAAAPAILSLVDGQTGSEFSYSIPAGSSQTFTTSNSAGEATIGSVRAIPNSGSVAPSGLVVISFTAGGKTFLEVGANAQTAGSAFHLYAEASGTPGQAGSIQTGLVITNAVDTANTVTLEVRDSDGTLAAPPATLPLPPSGLVARFIDELFASLPDEFSGVLRVTSTADVAVLGLRLRTNDRGELKITTTLPSDETGALAMEDRFFPHIVDSAGWSTQFNLFSGIAGQASTGTLSFIDTEGEPWDLPIENNVPEVVPPGGDSDGDGIPDVSDPDDDNDGVADTDDPCPLDSADTCDDTTSVVSLEVSGAIPLTSIGQTIPIAATAHRLDGSSQGIASAFVHWVSVDPAVVTVIDGTVTAVGPGNARIVATYQGQKAVVEVSVHISVRETGTVRVIYAAPSDREFRSDYRDAIQHAIVDLQSWYRRQLGGLTFSLYDATPEQCQLSGNHDDYDSGDVWAKILEGVQHCAAVGHGSAEFVWVLYVAVKEECGEEHELGRGGSGVTMLQAAEGDFDLGPYYYCDEGPYERTSGGVIGGLGHELGHALGLPHPPGCDEGLPTCDYDALMHDGYTTYPNTYLRPDDKQVLWRSPFIEKNPAQRQLMEEAGIVAAIRGIVSNLGGEVVEGIRVSAVSDDFWAWGETASDGTFEIRLPDGSSGSSVLSVHAGGVADCGWLGYHVAGGLTTFLEHATRIELGEVDPASIEISLPAISGELCQGQSTVSGSVLGPSGDPVGVFVGAFEQWSFSGDDGLFELRLPEGLGGSSPLLVEAPECSNVGFYGPGGFTTRPADAWQWELGGVNEAGIVIRLPATPEELCRRQPTIAGTVVGPDGEVMEGIEVVALPFWRWGTSEADGAFEIRLLEGTTGMPVLGIHADCGQVGYYGPNGFTTSREDATEIEIGEGNVTGIAIRLPATSHELCGQ